MNTHELKTIIFDPEYMLWPAEQPLPSNAVWAVSPTETEARAQVILLTDQIYAYRKLIHELNNACRRYRRKAKGLREGKKLLIQTTPKDPFARTKLSKMQFFDSAPLFNPSQHLTL